MQHGALHRQNEDVVYAEQLLAVTIAQPSLAVAESVT